MIPNNFSLAAIQDMARDVYQKLDSLLVRNVDLNGRRITNAGKSVQDFDYVTRFELDRFVESMQVPTQTQVITTPTAALNAAIAVRFGAFTSRGSSVAHVNELFYASDLDYMGWFSTGAAWIYVSGVRSIAQSAISTFTANLTTSDAGARINVTDYTHLLRWTGSALEFAPGDSGSGYIQGFPITPPGGTWGLCDGTAYNYLKADGTTASFTTPDYSTAAYLKLGTSATIGPTAASGVTTSVSGGTPSGSNSAPTFTGSAAASSVSAAAGGDVTAVQHPYTPAGSVSAPTFSGNALAGHDHGPNTLELRRSLLIGYFRR